MVLYKYFKNIIYMIDFIFYKIKDGPVTIILEESAEKFEKNIN
jgi:hypothetical protein